MLRSAVANVAAFFIAAGAAFVVSPILVHRLGDVGYGTWIMLASLVGYLTLLDLGVRSAITHFIAAFHAGREHEDAGRLASAALGIFTAAALVAVLASVVFAANVTELLNLPPEYAPAARLVVILGGVTVAVSLIANTYGGIIAGLHRFDALSVIEVVIELLRAAVTIFVLSLTPSLVALAIIQLVAAVGRGLAFLVMARREYPELSVRLWTGGRTEHRKLLGFAVSVTVLSLVAMAVMHTQSIIVGVVLSTSMVTYYAISANLSGYARSTADAIAAALTPGVSALARLEGRHAVGPVVLDTARLGTLALLPIAITLLLRGGSFIDLWMGPNYGALSGPALVVLTLPIWGVAWRQSVLATLCGLNRHRRLVPYYVLEGIVTLALSVWLAHRMGILGVAWAFTLPRILMSVIVLPLIMRTELDLPLMKTWAQLVVRPTVAMVPFAAVTFLLERTSPAGSMLVFFAQVGLALPAAFLGAWVVGLREAERTYARARIHQVLSPRDAPKPSPVEPA
jgi:O-antigen/teichoic acid export membrane protein